MDSKNNRKKIAEVTGWDLPRISRYFRGITIPSIKHAKIMSEAAGIDFVELCEIIINNNEKREVSNNGK